VASVKPNTSNPAPPTIRLAIQPGGRFTATNVTVRELIRVAYRAPDPLDDARVIGGPGWTESERFDLVAKAPAESGTQQLSLMLGALLADRFSLTLRRDMRELPIYALVMAGPGGKLGPNLHASEDCTATHREPAPAAGYR
jgi:uncharacterized protein (TIGR03435 family)